jgi:hypothetical protein
LLENRRSGAKLTDDFTDMSATAAAESLENIATDVLATNVFQIIQDLRMPTLPSELDSYFAGTPGLQRSRRRAQHHFSHCLNCIRSRKIYRKEADGKWFKQEARC